METEYTHIRLLPKTKFVEKQHKISIQLIYDFFLIDEINETDTSKTLGIKDPDFIITHTTIMRPTFSLNLSPEFRDEFFERYNKIIYNNSKKDDKIFISITEKPQEISMFCIDVDNKIQSYIIYHLFNQEDILRTIRYTNDIIKKMNPDITDDKLICIVLTKNPYITTINGVDYIKHGYHIQYVNLFISKENRKMIQKESNIGDTIYNNNWLLYGSYKQPDTGTYVFSKIYDHNLEEIQLIDFLDTYEVYNTKEKFKPNKYQLSQVLSIHPFNRKITHGFTTESGRSKEKLRLRTEISDLDLDLDLDLPLSTRVADEVDLPLSTRVADEVEELTDICSLLTIQHSDDYKTWSVVGLCLYTITNGSSEGLIRYKKFSSLSSKYNETETTNKYNKIILNNNYNLKSLSRLVGYTTNGIRRSKMERLLKISPKADGRLEVDEVIKKKEKTSLSRKKKIIYNYTLDKKPVRKWVLKPVENITDYRFNYASDNTTVITTITDTYTNSYFIKL